MYGTCIFVYVHAGKIHVHAHTNSPASEGLVHTHPNKSRLEMLKGSLP